MLDSSLIDNNQSERRVDDSPAASSFGIDDIESYL